MDEQSLNSRCAPFSPCLSPPFEILVCVLEFMRASRKEKRKTKITNQWLNQCLKINTLPPGGRSVWVNINPAKKKRWEGASERSFVPGVSHFKRIFIFSGCMWGLNIPVAATPSQRSNPKAQRKIWLDSTKLWIRHCWFYFLLFLL